MFSKMCREDLASCGIVRCLKCGQILVSAYTHDFVQCKCDNETFVDGGASYTRCGGIETKFVHVITYSGKTST